MNFKRIFIVMSAFIPLFLFGCASTPKVDKNAVTVRFFVDDYNDPGKDLGTTKYAKDRLISLSFAGSPDLDVELVYNEVFKMNPNVPHTVKVRVVEFKRVKKTQKLPKNLWQWLSNQEGTTKITIKEQILSDQVITLEIPALKAGKYKIDPIGPSLIELTKDNFLALKAIVLGKPDGTLRPFAKEFLTREQNEASAAEGKIEG